MQIAALSIYPVKSTRAHTLDTAVVEPWGLAGDRRWMVVDGDGFVVTARQHPSLQAVVATPLGPGELRLESPHAATVVVAAGGPPAEVRIWKSTVKAMPADPRADAWFSALLGLGARLVWLDDPTRRPTNPAHSRPSDRVSFADAYPLLLTSTASLHRLDEWMTAVAVERGEEAPSPLSMRRFRPSVVVDHYVAFAEDTWTRIRLGGVDFRVSKGCDRCVMTTIDPDTLAKGKEPLRTLARHRRREGKVWFGVQLIPDATGTIGVGDSVAVLESVPI